MKRYFFSLLMLASLASVAQEGKKFVIKAGSRPKDTFSFNDIYKYPSFMTANINFRNNTSGTARMNYNKFTSEIDFIKGKDTLALADHDAIKSIIIGNDAFFYQPDIGYVVRIAEAPKGSLAKREFLELADRRRHPNSGSTSQVSNGSYNNQITTGAGVASGLSLNMVEQEDLIYRLKTDYYFGNPKGFYVKTDKKNLLRTFPDKKSFLNEYLEKHNVDFHNPDSLQHLFNIVTTMQ